VKSKLMRSDKLFLSEMVHRNNRKQVIISWLQWSSQYGHSYLAKITVSRDDFRLFQSLNLRH
jgi:hypothetical protein